MEVTTQMLRGYNNKEARRGDAAPHSRPRQQAAASGRRRRGGCGRCRGHADPLAVLPVVAGGVVVEGLGALLIPVPLVLVKVVPVAPAEAPLPHRLGSAARAPRAAARRAAGSACAG